MAVVAGSLGSTMSKIILWIFRWKNNFKFRYQHLFYVLSCALIISSVAFFLDPRILGSGKEIMSRETAVLTNDVAAVADELPSPVRHGIHQAHGKRAAKNLIASFPIVLVL